MISIVRPEREMKEHAIAVIFAVIVACILLLKGSGVFIFLIFTIHLYMIFKYPEVALFVVVMVINDCFSMMDKDILRLPGVFRIKDLFFISAFLPLIGIIFNRKIASQKIILSNAVWTIIFFSVLEFLFTVFMKGQDIFYTFRMGRRYLYYLLFFPMVYLINNDEKFNRFMLLLKSAGVLFAMLMAIQYLLGPSTIIFKYASIAVQNLSGNNVLRSYVSGIDVAIMALYLFLFELLLNKNRAIVNMVMAIIIFLGGIYLSFGRANIFGVITGAVFALIIFFKSKNIVKFFIACILLIIFVFAISEGLRLCGDDSILNPVSFVFKHLETGFHDIIHQTGTFGFRLKDSAQRIFMIKNNLLFGIGFMHPESQILKLDAITTGIITADSGIISLLLDFGISGIIWLSLLTVYFFNASKKAYALALDNRKRIFILTAFSFYFGRLFSFVTLIDFIDAQGIVLISIALFMITFAQGRASDGPVDSNS